MPPLTIHQAAETTGWSARMLRYVEQLGLVHAARSSGGHRLYGPRELQRLRTLRALLDEHGLELAHVGFALRLREQPQLATALDDWFEAEPHRPELPAATPPPEPLEDDDWLRFEQAKHQQLLTP